MAPRNKPADTVEPLTGEVVEQAAQLPAIVMQGNTFVLPGGKVLKIKKKITRPLLRHPDNATHIIRFDGKIYTGKEIKGGGANPITKPAQLATVTNLLDGHEYDYIVNAVFEGILNEQFPKDGYVGHSFAVFKAPKAEGKRYNTFAVTEVE